MGHIAGAHGVRGWIKVVSYAESSAPLGGHSKWWVGEGETWREIAIAESAQHGSMLVARPNGVEDREAAQALKGLKVALARAALPPLQADELYLADLVGLEAINEAGDVLGKIVDVFSNGAHEVLRIRSSAESQASNSVERLVPWVPAIVREIDAGRRPCSVGVGAGLVMQLHVITQFPQMFSAVTEYGVTRRAFEEKRWSLELWNPRDFASDAHRTIDGRPYGGGPGMVMMAEPIELALAAIEARMDEPAPVVYLSPQGALLDEAKVRVLGSSERLVLLCGRYEGIDERLVARCVDEEISIGDYVLSGGELAAMVLIDAMVRRLPGVLGDAASAEQDSFVQGLLDCPHYTRPEIYAGEPVPSVLLSGHHADIARWRHKQSLGRTYRRRPELVARRGLTNEERVLLAEFQAEHSLQPM